MTDEARPTFKETMAVAAASALGEVGFAAATGQIPNPVGTAMVFVEAYIANRRKRAVDFVASVAEEVGEQKLRETTGEDDERETLLWNAMQASMATALRSKRIYLARVAANALNYDDLVDEAQLIVAALQELDGVHIRALTSLRIADDQQQAAPDLDDKIFNDALKRELAPVLTALLRAGVVSQGSKPREGGLHPIPDHETFQISGVNWFGRKLLDDLAAVDTSE
jgi:hypothetical protein